MPTVSAIIPARNEQANIARAVASVAAQAEAAEVIVVDDGSTDGTAGVLRGLAASQPTLRVLEAGALPDGWVGKNHALMIGASQARGDWLLFTDADTEVLSGGVARAMADADAAGAALVSYSPEQRMETWWERAVIPFVYCWLASRFSYDAVNDPQRPDAAANGQFLLIRREAYEQVGGHGALAAHVLEDVELARRVKSAGLGLYFAPGEGIARTRMYSSIDEMWDGWTKNLYLLAGAKKGNVLRELFAVIPWIPLLALALWPVNAALGVFGLLLLAGRHAVYAAQVRRNRYPARSVLYYLPGVAFFCAALLVSMWRHTRGAVVWKGREYRMGMES